MTRMTDSKLWKLRHKLYPTFTIHLSNLPAPHKDDRIIKRPRPGHRFSFEDLNYLVMDTAQKVTAMYPQWEFRMIRLRPDHVRFIYIGECKPATEPALPTEPEVQP